MEKRIRVREREGGTRKGKRENFKRNTNEKERKSE